jgi:hypothetical protein
MKSWTRLFTRIYNLVGNAPSSPAVAVSMRSEVICSLRVTPYGMSVVPRTRTKFDWKGRTKTFALAVLKTQRCPLEQLEAAARNPWYGTKFPLMLGHILIPLSADGELDVMGTKDIVMLISSATSRLLNWRYNIAIWSERATLLLQTQV